MASFLIVASRGSGSTWPVYFGDDSPRVEGELVRETGPLLRSVASWNELKSLADEHGLDGHQIVGVGLEEMEKEFGPMP